MTSNEIRNITISGEQYCAEQITSSMSMDDCAQFLREIAAQLAELNQRLRDK